MYYFLFILFLTVSYNNFLEGMDKKASNDSPRKSRSDETFLMSKKNSNKKKELKRTHSMGAISEKTTLSFKEYGLLKAARLNDIDRVNFYLENKSLNLNTIRDQQGNTALHVAAQYKHFRIIN